MSWLEPRQVWFGGFWGPLCREHHGETTGGQAALGLECPGVYRAGGALVGYLETEQAWPGIVPVGAILVPPWCNYQAWAGTSILGPGGCLQRTSRAAMGLVPGLTDLAGSLLYPDSVFFHAVMVKSEPKQWHLESPPIPEEDPAVLPPIGGSPSVSEWASFIYNLVAL